MKSFSAIFNKLTVKPGSKLPILAELKPCAKEIAKETESLLAKASLSHKKLMLIAWMNQHNRLDIIKRLHHYSFIHVLKKYPKTLHQPDHHYDWWMFPMDAVRLKWLDHNQLCSVNENEVATLLEDEDFVNEYIEAIELYLNALKENGWNQYSVRFARLLQSLSLFVQTAQSHLGAHADKTHRLKSIAASCLQYGKQHLFHRHLNYTVLNEGREHLIKALAQPTQGLTHR